MLLLRDTAGERVVQHNIAGLLAQLTLSPCMQATVGERDEELKANREKMEQMEVLPEQMHVLNKVRLLACLR